MQGGTDYTEGSVIEYTSFGGPRRVRVNHIEPDIKNGMPGFDGIVIDGAENGMAAWGYDYQVTRVIDRSPAG